MNSSSKIRVFLIDSNPEDEEIIQEMFKQADLACFECIPVPTISSVPYELIAGKADIVLVDLGLARLNNYEELATLKSYVPDTPVIILSELKHQTSALEAVKRGAEDFLTKGVFDKHHLEKTIMNAIERHDLVVKLDKSEKVAYEMAVKDPLTGLYNRMYFNTCIEQAFHRAIRHKSTMALLFIDIDNFKDINDSLGHSVGDQLLVSVSSFLTQAIRTMDIVARFGGDEFVIILEDLQKVDDAAIVAEKILNLMSQYHNLGQHKIQVKMSIGIAAYPSKDIVDAETLIKSADSAMYSAKNDGKNTYKFFEPEMRHKALERLNVIKWMPDALLKDQFMLHYQPQVDLKTHEIVGIEALIRWEREGQLIPPCDFIPIANELGFIIPLGNWIFSTACNQLKEINQYSEIPLRLGINVSVKQLMHDSLFLILDRILEESGVEPSQIELEVTEDVVIQDHERCIAILQTLRTKGFEVAIDDFGTGYSSLSYLKNLPIDTLKIDKSFIDDLIKDPLSQTIISSLVQISHNMGVRIIAEGTETLAQIERLESLGCDIAQGYYFSKPLPIDQLIRLLDSKKHPRIRFGT